MLAGRQPVRGWSKCDAKLRESCLVIASRIRTTGLAVSIESNIFLELVANNQLAMQEHHDEEFKKLMTWQVLTQGQIEKIGAKIDKLSDKIDRQADLQAGFDARVDKLVAAIGEFIRRADARA
jgi:peptidoglycan hydrolase CwlO-like protein